MSLAFWGRGEGHENLVGVPVPSTEYSMDNLWRTLGMHSSSLLRMPAVHHYYWHTICKATLQDGGPFARTIWEGRYSKDVKSN